MSQSSSISFINIWEGNNSNKETILFDTQDILDNKIDKFTSMMSKLSAQRSNQDKPFKPKILKEKGEDMEEIIMTKVDTKLDTDQIVEIDTVDHHTEVELSTDNIIEKVSVLFKNYRGNFRKGNFRQAQNYRGQISEEDIEVASGAVVLIEVDLGLEKDNSG